MDYHAYPWIRWIKLGVSGIVILITLASLVSTYNGLAASNQEVESRWSQVENVMQSRADKITNLVEVVKGYAKHEEKVFGDVAAARSVLMNGSSDVESKLNADTSMASASKGVLLLVEDYPDLKASQQFQDLQVAIEGSENRVAVERMRFITAVQAYNTKVTSFPGNIFAKAMGFAPKKYFEAAPEAQQAPKINF